MHYNYFQNWPTFLSLLVWVYRYSRLCSGLQNTHLFCTRVRFGRSRSSKVDDFVTNRKRVYDFLLVGHGDYGPILHRFWDTSTYWLRLPIFPTPLSFGAVLPIPLEFCDEVNRQETRVMGLSYSEDPVIVAWVALTWYQTVTDRQTEGRNLS